MTAIRKKLSVGMTAVIAAALILVGGAFAWQSISQTALNEASGVVNPGGRLHNDFNGENADVYVENFADEPIFARVRLGEFLALTNNRGVVGAERENILLGGRDDTGARTCETHLFGADSTSGGYWTWRTGGETVYMPTFNRNKDSLAADVNGTYLGADGRVTEQTDDDRYSDYVTYAVGQTRTDREIYDADGNTVDEVGSDFARLESYAEAGNVILREGVTHRAKKTLRAAFLSMDDWLATVERDGGYEPDRHGGCWVYDSDGWVYWSAPIQPDTATGLLLDGIRLSGVMDDSWYYAIEVTAQFITADDAGQADGTGFYESAAGAAPSEAAERLLAAIGVHLVP